MPLRANEWCLMHGAEDHARVHEAGHAVAAIDLGIPIVAVVLNPTPSHIKAGRTDELADGTTRVDVTALRAARAAGAISNGALFLFAAAGMTAESALLGHATPGGAAADFREFWAWTKGQTFVDEEEYTEVLGEPRSLAQVRATEWAKRRSGAIGALARMLKPGRELSADDLAQICRRLPPAGAGEPRAVLVD